MPFLSAGIPSLLLWHFTDQFYHTDGDRLDMVSPEELKNVGVTALVSGLTMANADTNVVIGLVEEVRLAAIKRLSAETALSIAAIGDGANFDEQRDIIKTWAAWYDGALASMDDIEVGGSSVTTAESIDAARQSVRLFSAGNIASLTM